MTVSAFLAPRGFDGPLTAEHYGLWQLAWAMSYVTQAAEDERWPWQDISLDDSHCRERRRVGEDGNGECPRCDGATFAREDTDEAWVGSYLEFCADCGLLVFEYDNFGYYDRRAAEAREFEAADEDFEP